MRSRLQKGKSNKILKVRVLTGALSFCLEGATNEIPLHNIHQCMDSSTNVIIQHTTTVLYI